MHFEQYCHFLKFQLDILNKKFIYSTWLVRGKFHWQTVKIISNFKKLNFCKTVRFEKFNFCEIFWKKSKHSFITFTRSFYKWHFDCCNDFFKLLILFKYYINIKISTKYFQQKINYLIWLSSEKLRYQKSKLISSFAKRIFLQHN